ncbi:hypothetical protein ASE35_15840 [Lysobacter sp. Root916]|nr:hypothetical protein ASE35_15840 [Lysobacter sp. Root916]
MSARRGANAAALMLALALSGGAAAAETAAARSEVESDAVRLLRELAIADGMRLSRASLCGYGEDDLGRLAASLRAQTDARAREAGVSVDEARYGDDMYEGMGQSMIELLKLPAEEIADEQSYRASHCAEVRGDIDALLRQAP